MGHSMGGHGALVCGFNNPGKYRSVSAFVPICAPSECPWDLKAFNCCLGSNKDAWRRYDASELAKRAPLSFPILVDQGSQDQFLDEQRNPERLTTACQSSGQELRLHRRLGYDHSYFFISSFIQDHITYHARYLKA